MGAMRPACVQWWHGMEVVRGWHGGYVHGGVPRLHA
jgi:hypothetical protein